MGYTFISGITLWLVILGLATSHMAHVIIGPLVCILPYFLAQSISTNCPQFVFKFRLGSRTVLAQSAERLDPNRTVYRLQLRQSQLLKSVLRIVLAICPWVETRWPEWFLPSTVILKMQKIDWEGQFNTELRAYTDLRSLQGTLLPRLYGIAFVNHIPALVLSEVDGNRLNELRTLEDSDKLKKALEVFFKTLTEYEYIHQDVELHNFFISSGPPYLITAVDWEFSEKKRETTWEGSENQGNVDHLMYKWKLGLGVVDMDPFWYTG